ncbi:TolC family protein [Bacteroides helcogenes]|uniref:Outer membrane efflux protein n=1 Tax=Bacteroides helcogenes (strain ATCC 35417 / DSM 20613 / JCM 6297 / CCUG 15421 / P 36-108) TaxID=693979 RepID=E6STZ0_BACT6|nr:TolC family protein [Bacteroides helcogenes]ADV43291.1 outer membrane efflux protein [Bacteroides helcogenes P 36-108]MDY5238630.1 TolC family protein [Bacteroides helcogenes]
MRTNNIYILFLSVMLAVPFTGLRAQTDTMYPPRQNLTFGAYLNRVGKQNLEYLASQLNVSIAEAELAAARVLPDPLFNFEGNKETYKLGLSCSLELGKRCARVKLMRSQSELEKLALEQGFQVLRAQATELYLDAILQRELLKVKESSYRYMVSLSRSDSLRCVLGEIAENDARQSRVEAMNLLNEVYDQESAYHSSLVGLNRFMGMAADTLSVPLENWGNQERDFALASLLELGKANRIDLLVASKNVDVNSQAYKLTCAGRRPDIGLSLSYEREWKSLLPQARYATVGVSVPLLFSTINKGAVKSAKYRIDQAVVMQKNVELQIQAEITHAWFVFEAERKKVAQYRSGVLEESLKVLDSVIYKYRHGETSILDVLMAQRAYNEIRQNYLKTINGYVVALVALEKSCGVWDICF